MAEIQLDPPKAIASLTRAAQAVFADMAFLDVEPVAANSEPGKGPGAGEPQVATIRVAIDLLVPLSCRLELQCTTSLVEKLLDTFYGDSGLLEKGVEPKVDRSRDDSLLEMVNILAGTFLSDYFGSGTSFKLELPFYIYGETEISGPEIAHLPLDAEGERFSLILRSIRYRY